MNLALASDSAVVSRRASSYWKLSAGLPLIIDSQIDVALIDKVHKRHARYPDVYRLQPAKHAENPGPGIAGVSGSPDRSTTAAAVLQDSDRRYARRMKKLKSRRLNRVCQ